MKKITSDEIREAAALLDAAQRDDPNPDPGPKAEELVPSLDHEALSLYADQRGPAMVRDLSAAMTQVSEEVGGERVSKISPEMIAGIAMRSTFQHGFVVGLIVAQRRAEK